MKALFFAILFSLILSLSSCGISQAPAPGANGGTTTNATTQGSTAKQSTTQPAQKVFTADELKKYNGQNGNPAYVAVDGVVYDVTKSGLWRGGSHEGCSNAGYDLTDSINNSPHGKQVITRMPVVGVYKK